MTVAKEPGHRGERDISRKTIACGNAGRSGVLVVARVRSTNTKGTRDRGCSGHPAFPTPFVFQGERFINGSGASRGEAVKSCLDVIASGAKQSILSLCGEMDCFASLAMTVPLFEN
jgi:hypothetical protein